MFAVLPPRPPSPPSKEPQVVQDRFGDCFSVDGRLLGADGGKPNWHEVVIAIFHRLVDQTGGARVRFMRDDFLREAEKDWHLLCWNRDGNLKRNFRQYLKQRGGRHGLHAVDAAAGGYSLGTDLPRDPLTSVKLQSKSSEASSRTVQSRVEYSFGEDGHLRGAGGSKPTRYVVVAAIFDMLVEQSGGERMWFTPNQVLQAAKSHWDVMCWPFELSARWEIRFKHITRNLDGRHGLQVRMESPGIYEIGRETAGSQTATGKRQSGSGSDVAFEDGDLNSEERTKKASKSYLAPNVFERAFGECDDDTGTDLGSCPLSMPLVCTAAVPSLPAISELVPAGKKPLTPTVARSCANLAIDEEDMWPGVAPFEQDSITSCARGSYVDFSLGARLMSELCSDSKSSGSADDDGPGMAGLTLENPAFRNGTEKSRQGNTSPDSRVPVAISSEILPGNADIALCEIAGKFFESREYLSFSEELHNSRKDVGELDLALCVFFHRMHQQVSSQRMYELCNSLHGALVAKNVFLCRSLPLSVSALASWRSLEILKTS